MLNFAEQTGSGAVMLVWSFLISLDALNNLYPAVLHVARSFDATLVRERPQQERKQCDDHGAFSSYNQPKTYNTTKRHLSNANAEENMTRIENLWKQCL